MSPHTVVTSRPWTPRPGSDPITFYAPSKGQISLHRDQHTGQVYASLLAQVPVVLDPSGMEYKTLQIGRASHTVANIGQLKVIGPDGPDRTVISLPGGEKVTVALTCWVSFGIDCADDVMALIQSAVTRAAAELRAGAHHPAQGTDADGTLFDFTADSDAEANAPPFIPSTASADSADTRRPPAPHESVRPDTSLHTPSRQARTRALTDHPEPALHSAAQVLHAQAHSAAAHHAKNYERGIVDHRTVVLQLASLVRTYNDEREPELKQVLRAISDLRQRHRRGLLPGGEPAFEAALHGLIDTRNLLSLELSDLLAFYDLSTTESDPEPK